MKVCILGLGYVGCVSAACLSKVGHEVIGVDINQAKVDMVKEGRSPLVEPGLDDLIREEVAGGRLQATSDFDAAVGCCEVTMVCVGTPSAPNGSLQLEFVYRVARQFGNALKNIDVFRVVAIRSTVLPGTLDSVVEIISDLSGKREGRDFGACSNPEFLREGSAIKDFHSAPYTIIGTRSQSAGDTMGRLYQPFDIPALVTAPRTAEMIKYASNAFHALKIAFANEVGTLCKISGVDSHELMDVFCRDDRLNVSAAYLKPGFAFGGSCLPKDLRALTYLAKQSDLDLPLLSTILPSNERHLQRAINLLLSYGRKRVGVLGLSFKEDTDDLRESPMVHLVETLIGKGYDVRIYDKNVHLARLYGANKKYIVEKIPHISRLIVTDWKQILDHAEVLAIGNNCAEFAEIVARARAETVVCDLVKLMDSTAVGNRYDGLCW